MKMLKKIFYKAVHFSQCIIYYALRLFSIQIIPLWALSAYYKLDKATYSGFHNYISVYERIFRNLKKSASTVVEIGIGVTESGQMAHMTGLGYRTGNSLRCWRDYFLNAQIIGIDIHKVDIFEERITTYVGDQRDEKSMKNIFNSIDRRIDIIIDDGTHEYDDQINNFIWLNNYLYNKGLYIIEDVDYEEISKFQKFEGVSLELKRIIQKTFKLNIIIESTKNNNCMVIFEKIS